VAVRTREIYHSANGIGGYSPAIRILAGCSLGMSPTFPQVDADIEIGAFLIAAGSGPEKQELLRLIGTLV